MTKAIKANRIWLSAAAVVVAVGLGCSTKSPTAPQQTPAPPAGTEVSAFWNITVSISPDEIARDSSEPARVAIRVRRADDNTPPPQGTTIVVSTSLGEFVALGSGLTSIALATSNGRAETLFFPGAITGTAVITAQLESSAGQSGVRIREGVVAAFDTANGEDNLSIQFINRSTGDPRRFFWDFGDGSSSREENPAHRYPSPGDYVVSLTVERGVFSDTVVTPVFVVEPIFIKDIDPNSGPEGTQASIFGQGFVQPLRVFFDDLNAEVLFVSGDRRLISVIVPIVDEFPVEDCILTLEDDSTTTGEQNVDRLVDIRVESLSESVRTDTLQQAFIITAPPEIGVCREKPDDGNDTGGNGGTGGG